ncbi:aspartate aminotransferase family protein, partial [Candidatus Sumerlaeota bacterium]|nr:aspartate aminotransferase family protein [Candidatus Sumerlaeota bacterium]
MDERLPPTGHFTWRQIDDLAARRPMLVRAEGIRLYYGDGSSAIDASGGPVCVGVGHGRREVAAAVAAQMGKFSYGFDAPIIREFAKQLARITPGDLNRVYPCSGGSEAVENAIRFARHYHCETGNPSKFKIIGRWTSYHGNTLGAASVSGGIARRIKYGPMLVPFPHIDPCYCYRCPFHLEYPSCKVLCAEKLEDAILREGPETVAAFI